MDRDRAIFFAGQMEDFLHIPAGICEVIEQKLVAGKYQEVIDFVIDRKKTLLKESEIFEISEEEK